MTKNKLTFAADVTALIERNIADRNERITAINELTDSYDRTDMDPTQLERLSDYVLREELTDRHPDKITRNEYPFMSTWQLDIRHEREYSLDLAENHGTDGANYNVPARRHRIAKETRFVDKMAMAKNRERSARYKRDTSPGELVSYNLRDTGGEFAPEFTQRVGLGRRWIDELTQTALLT
ncbi:hypothetical protein [Paenibacillus planticolens]|uniref:Uncharacterized protein n=1 Tax=Paenibacillus planticolens TaxID=2654976 RepID=A0ABX1ZFM7_9BACL|nr:hypothetical protein [Paenibacillus planticolens]NOU98467.1 hypothetical protein [Paenibacillus planticolens]